MGVDIYLNSFLNPSARWGWVVNHTTPLDPQERDLVPIVQEARSVPGSVWTGAENLPHCNAINIH